MKKESIFSKVDQFIFQQINQFQATTLFESLNNWVSSASEEFQKLLRPIISVILLVIPTIFFLIFSLNLHQQIAQLDVKKDLYRAMEEVIELDRSFQANKGLMMAANGYPLEADFTTKLRHQLTMFGINLERVQVKNFEATTHVDYIEAHGTIHFSKLTTEQLMGLLEHLINTEKIKVNSLVIEKGPEGQLLNGHFSIIHLGEKL